MSSEGKLGSPQLMDETPEQEIIAGKDMAAEWAAHNHKENAALNFQSLLVSVSVCADAYKEKILNLALSASGELMQMAQEQEPLWLFDTSKTTEILNDAEYKRRFVSLDVTLDEIISLICTGDSIEDHLGTNQTASGAASRSIGIVFGSPVSLVNILMNEEHWSSVFSNIVSKATTLGVLFPGEKKTHDGALKVMAAEFYLPSPLFTPREVKFARFCRQTDVKTWVVADVSLESVFPNQAVPCLHRRPSGCLIQELQPSLSMVTWVENNVVHDGFVHEMFRKLLISDFPFNAKRWVATLERYYDRMASLETQVGHFPQPIGLGAENKNMLRLTQRMVKHYTGNVSPCSNHAWVALPTNTADEIFVRTSINLDDPGLPVGLALTISTSVWLPIPQNNLFEFLRNARCRNKWDLLSIGLNVREEMRICSTRDPANSVSIHIVECPNKTKPPMLYLQESFSDSVGMYVVYAPMDVDAMQCVLEGKNADQISILPSGFAILSDMPKQDSGGGSILTISFQIVDHQLSSPDYLPPNSVLTTHNLVCQTVSLIKAALQCN